jgi:hypothetical protein
MMLRLGFYLFWWTALYSRCIAQGFLFRRTFRHRCHRFDSILVDLDNNVHHRVGLSTRNKLNYKPDVFC